MATNLRGMTALEIGGLIRDRKLSCTEAVRHALGLIEASRLNAFTCVLEREAMDEAERVQKRLDAGERLSPLAGVPMALKDNICTEGVETSCASKMLAGFRPPYSATAAERLRQAGAILTGKLNMDEFAMGGTSESSFRGEPRNPWDLSRTPGGSSGGSAAAVAAGEILFSLGSDTGGSIRQPASLCGVTGLKPTYGAVSRWGLVACASSLDQIGPIARDAADCAAVLDIIEGADGKDATLPECPKRRLLDSLTGGVDGLTVGIPEECFGEGLASNVRACVMEGAKILERMGARLKSIRLPLLRYAPPAYDIVACAEISSNLARYDGIRYGLRSGAERNPRDLYVSSRSGGFGMEVKRRIMLGSFVLGAERYDAYYGRAQRARTLLSRELIGAFADCRLILCPTAPATAGRLGESGPDPQGVHLGGMCTASANLAGLPAASIPCGFAGGLPVGMQLMAPAFGEDVLLRAAHAFQLETDFHRSLPEGGKTNE